MVFNEKDIKDQSLPMAMPVPIVYPTRTQSQSNPDPSSTFNLDEGSLTSSPDPFLSDAESRAHCSPLSNSFYFFFELPSSPLARAFSFLSSLCVLASIAIIAVSSLPRFQEVGNEWGSAKYKRWWGPAYGVMGCVFLVEFVGRVVGVGAGRRRGGVWGRVWWCLRPLNLIDAFSSVPFWVELIQTNTPTARIFQVLRIFLLFRIVKVGQFTEWSIGMKVTFRVFRRSLAQILLVSFYTLIVILVAASCVYYAERGTWKQGQGVWVRSDGSVSPFQSIPGSWYWAVVTVTTLGYGDQYPITNVGRFIACLAALSGMMVIALPTSIIGSNYGREWADYERRRTRVRMRELTRRQAQANADDPAHTHRLTRTTTFGSLFSRTPTIIQGLPSSHAHSPGASHAHIRTLKETNELLLNAVVRAQEQLDGVAPLAQERWYVKWKETEAENVRLRLRVRELEEAQGGRVENITDVKETVIQFQQ
ncbi:voltage-gated potassium channel [Saitoella complicata NRRL Y-17804]|uniref:Ion transport domain-containing protein n=1 Tax=Saitoella complicata (strain BCRC 22490 / CBS 7301 / JCM 7358 / NBRC 10748 / NRRL Y-17804) TaxID=698492 RepID=A0A0E9NID5_SAICN|nr:voltage-gated potassium channel [Saitoella complicata NRRL Y-17804]ODQ50994.1 voltage-gated potassium channel [Saitoella complicata NRRL Y-17804]GAO49632.1 hypothetical protein G7K_3781-t1 [Saitoella complicata NRRL Y-17804]